MKYVLLMMILILASCTLFNQESVKATEAEVKIYNEWLYAYKLNDLKIDAALITRPPGIEQLLFSLLLPTEGGLNLKTHCVYYRVPYKQISGLLKIEEQKSIGECPSLSQGKVWLQLDGLRDLSLKLENFQLSLNFNYQNQKIAWKFLLPNLEGGLTHQKYQPPTEKKLYPGMTFLKISEDSFDPESNSYLGKLSDRMARGSAIRCMQLDKSCQQVGEDRCDECRYGWYQVVDYNCPQGGSRFCGQNHCGEKNEPACVRGTKLFEGDDAGICQSDLTAVMNADHILVCQ